jgi:hypothetical protein
MKNIKNKILIVDMTEMNTYPEKELAATFPGEVVILTNMENKIFTYSKNMIAPDERKAVFPIIDILQHLVLVGIVLDIKPQRGLLPKILYWINTFEAKNEVVKVNYKKMLKTTNITNSTF